MQNEKSPQPLVIDDWLELEALEEVLSNWQYSHGRSSTHYYQVHAVLRRVISSLISFN